MDEEDDQEDREEKKLQLAEEKLLLCDKPKVNNE